jgi:peptidoglycan hydrolase-like protein with peptidoglycan-binding domain
MQRESDQIARQQEILARLGFYHGKIDGAWGPKTIDAMKGFERSPLFRPALPNNGLPLSEKGPYPKGMSLKDGLFWHPCMSAPASPQQGMSASQLGQPVPPIVQAAQSVVVEAKEPVLEPLTQGPSVAATEAVGSAEVAVMPTEPPQTEGQQATQQSNKMKLDKFRK